MPVWGLVATSLGFLIPSILAFKNNKKRLGYACTTLTTTSTLFHGTRHPIFRRIDMTYVYCLVSYYITKSIWRLVHHKRARDIYLHVGSLGCVYLYFSKCDNPYVSIQMQQRFHMLFHMAAQYLFCIYATDKI
jgi:hypothetical protein